MLRDRGVIRYSVLLDSLGDDEPGGNLIEEFPPERRGPHPGFSEDFDFCAIATEVLIGPSAHIAGRREEMSHDPPQAMETATGITWSLLHPPPRRS